MLHCGDTDPDAMADEVAPPVNIKTEHLDLSQTDPIPGGAGNNNKTIDSVESTMSSIERSNKFPHLRSDLEIRSKALTKAWTDLNALLTEYKAELYKAENVPNKYDSVTNLDQLRNELIEKENENIQLTQQFESLQQAHEQTKMDLSIQDSLLKKYQDDLLQKETLLITANSKICGLENKLKQLEAKRSDLPRKLMKTSLSGAGRLNVSGALKVGAGVRPGPKHTKIHPRPKQTSAPFTTSQPSTSISPAEPIVCIEVDDDDVISDVTHAAEQSTTVSETSLPQAEQDSLYLEEYGEGTTSGLEQSNSSLRESQDQAQLVEYDDNSQYEDSEQYSGLELDPQQNEGAPGGENWSQIDSIRIQQHHQQQRPMLNLNKTEVKVEEEEKEEEEKEEEEGEEAIESLEPDTSTDDLELAPSSDKRKIRTIPKDSIRYSGRGHLPEWGSRGRCAYCAQFGVRSDTGVLCRKCDVRLCFSKKRNCFSVYHMK